MQNGRAMVGLVLDLLRRGLLPAIAFSFERRVCHRLAQAMVEYLEVGERRLDGLVCLIRSKTRHKVRLRGLACAAASQLARLLLIV